MKKRKKKKKEEKKKTYNQSPRPSKISILLPINKHHPGYHPHIMLPPMSQLMPPFLLNNLALVNLVNSPQMSIILIKKNRLEDVILIRDRRGFVVPIARFGAKLVLVIGAVECHFDFGWVFRVGMGVVHGSKAAWFAVVAAGFGFGEFDHFLLRFGFGVCAEIVFEAGFVVLFEVFAVRVGDGDVVVESGAS